MRLRFWNSSQSSTLVMMEGCLDNPKTSAPRRKTRVATYWFAPLIRLTTAMTAATPLTTPISVSTLRSLCAQRLEAEMATASDKFIVVGRGIDPGDTNAPHPNIRPGGLQNNLPVRPVVSMLGEMIVLQKEKGRPDEIGTPWKATVAPVRRTGKELEGEPQPQTDITAKLEQIGLAVLAVDSEGTTSRGRIRRCVVQQGRNVIRMLSCRVEGTAIADEKTARRDEARGKVGVNLRGACSGCPPVEQVIEGSGEANVLRLAKLVAVAHLEVRLRKPGCAKNAAAAYRYSTCGRVLSDVDPLSAACDQRRERAWESKTNVRVTVLRSPTVKVGEEAEVGGVVLAFVQLVMGPTLEGMRAIRGQRSTGGLAVGGP